MQFHTPKKSKRPKYFGHSPAGSPKPKSFNSIRNEIEETAIESVNDSDKILKLVSRYGLNRVVQMKSVIGSIPLNFPHRLEFAVDICMSSTDFQCYTELDIRQALCLVDDLPIIQASVDSLLLNASMKLKKSFGFFLCPKVEECLCEGCNGKLYGRREEITECTLYSLNGPIAGLKAVLFCSKCGSRYGIDSFRPRRKDAQIYPDHLSSDVIQASNKAYFSQDTYEFMCESGNHGFVSAQAFSQIYQTVFHADHTSTRKFILATSSETNVLQENQTQIVDGVQLTTFPAIPNEMHREMENDVEISSSGYRLNPFMSRKIASEAFFSGELNKEVRSRNMETVLTFKNDSSREEVMKKIDDLRKTELYLHPEEDCNQVCQKRGCKNLRVIDSCWKLCIPHCMLAVPTEVKGSSLLTFPNVCTEEPMAGSVFCQNHYEVLVRNSVPTEKRAFLRFIGCKENPTSQEDIKRVDERVLQFMLELRDKDSALNEIQTSATIYQGTAELINKYEVETLNTISPKTACNKDTGEKGRLRQRARGHFAAVSGGGNILCFNPIYKSESPSQVFMLTVQMIYNEMKDVPEHEIEEKLRKYILSYDNMCNLDKLKAAREDLPLPGHLAKMWTHIRKIIDRLHIKNHKDRRCQNVYNPEKVLEENEKNVNTMAAEQLFAWMSRFKKIVNSMTQTHHLFYLHRMCIRRNKYSALCRKRGVEPVHPGINSKLL
ncbi:uncharacterized protein LOC132740163 [Ruditapes philippinarum]|uniref:uncharacterized protein LOC132740163 n=1 Tax=Ruditapes philippinarum TaxID=129788 RepID=UPI00295A6F2F|nr:uncharacterized protein LOC132740163 [Ruditapes philippinarum]